MSVGCGSSIPAHFRHDIVRRWKCDDCQRQALLDEIELYVATVYDRGHFIIRSCRRCQGKRKRLKWKEKASMRRLRERIRRRGWSTGAERAHIQRRAGIALSSPASVSG